MGWARLLGISLLATLVLGWPSDLRAAAAADETKIARGTVTAMTADSLTVKVRDKEMKFNVDDKTRVIARGAGTKSRQAQAAGASGVKLADVVKTNDAVEVTYHDMNGTYHAAQIRAVASPGPGGGSTSDDQPAQPAAKTVSGTVKSVSTDTLTITDAGKDWTFTMDGKTTVVGRGLGTKAAATGGKAPVATLVAAGDKVSVTYHDMGGTMHAATIRVTAKAKT